MKFREGNRRGNCLCLNESRDAGFGKNRLHQSRRSVGTNRPALYNRSAGSVYRRVCLSGGENAEEVENALHTAFAPSRINPRREFFRIDSEQAIAILRLLHVDEATNELSQQSGDIDPESMEAAKQLISRRPNLNFEEMGIPVGAILQFTRSDTPITVTVVGPKKVKLNDEEMSLTAATRQLRNLDYDVAPGPYWTFEGRTIREIYNETYTNEE
jgi:hypothetical protein